MSQSSPAPGEMARDELEAEVKENREKIRQLETDMAFMKKALTELTDAELEGEGVMELPDAGREMRDEFDDLASAVGSHGEQLDAVTDVSEKKTDKEQKVASIAAFASQKAGNPNATVLVKASELRGCTGVSRRYAYDLIDDIGGGDEFGWASVREAKTVKTGSGQEQKPKGLLVDCDKIRTSSQDDGVVNKFTTTSHEEGV